MVAAQLAAADYTGALKSWQTFRGLPDPNELAAIPSAGEDQIWLSYMLLPKGAGLWLMDSSGIKFHRIEAAGLREQAQRFAALVANPDSPGPLVEESRGSCMAPLFLSRRIQNTKR